MEIANRFETNNKIVNFINGIQFPLVIPPFIFLCVCYSELRDTHKNIHKLLSRSSIF